MKIFFASAYAAANRQSLVVEQLPSSPRVLHVFGFDGADITTVPIPAIEIQNLTEALSRWIYREATPARSDPMWQGAATDEEIAMILRNLCGCVACLDHVRLINRLRQCEAFLCQLRGVSPSTPACIGDPSSSPRT